MTLPRSAAKGGLAAFLATGAGLAVHRLAARREAEWEARWQPTGRFIDVDGTRVHVHVEGEGPDLVLIHGAGGNMRDFTFSLMPRLARTHRVIAIDRPGMGYTGRTRPEYVEAFSTEAETPREQADLMVRAARQLGAERPVVLGHSFGGTIALAWACYFPDSVAALVLLGAASNRWKGGLGPTYEVNGTPVGGAAVVPMLTAFGPQSKLRSIVRQTFHPNAMPEGYADHLGAELTLRRDALRANARQVNNLKPHIIAMEGIYPSLTLPIERIHGAADRTVPFDIHAAPFQDMVPHTNLLRLEGVGHMPHHVAEDETAAAVDRAVAAARDVSIA
ncbi:alpha/beta fold hydrolase [Jannaschia ovalis]|uniref:Alpha/beta fold hydrolase n=1 Tax=Jannaschia ovalis TaxID=3038773 RepID=A0ABY8LCJ1_9RHOB|nr:alpha/beta fold hydrolase [Jannaschia sp. GRR-S6-38]WGH78332.1 alpha/beta fold hydrolase [Jannaschia sp. GRR-S6-38]